MDVYVPPNSVSTLNCRLTLDDASQRHIGHSRSELLQLVQRHRALDDALDAKLRTKKRAFPIALTDEQAKTIRSLLNKRGVIARIGKEEVTDDDFARLHPDQWLNDNIINSYGQLLMSRAADSAAAKENNPTPPCLNVHYFSTFFWTKLLQGYEKSRLAKWTKKVR